MSESAKLRFTNAFDPLPDEPKLEDLRTIISTQQSRLASVEVDLEFIRQRLEAHEHHRNNLEKDIALSRGLSAPIRKLPFELLGMIFSNYSDAGGDPLILGLVCRRFHFALYNQPSAWRRILYQPHYRNLSLFNVQRALLLSGTCALDLIVDFSLLPYPETEKSAAVVAAELFFSAVEARSWRSIELIVGWQLHFKSIEPFLLCLTAQKQPLLRSFQVKFSDTEQSSVIGFPSAGNRLAIEEAVSQATQLRSLYIPSRFFQSKNAVFQNITDLKLWYYAGIGYEVSVEEVVRQCSNLESLSLSATFVTQPFVRRKPFKMQKLRSLEIIGANFAQEIFKTMMTPALEVLVIRNFGHGFKFTVEVLIKAFLSQKVRLKELRFRNVCCTQTLLLTTMRSLPTLVTLECTETNKLRDTFLKALAEEPNTRRPWICPALQNLHVEIRSPRLEIIENILDVRGYAETWAPPLTATGKKRAHHRNLVAPVPWEIFCINGNELMERP